MEKRKAFEQLIDKYVQGIPLSKEEQALLDSYFDAFDSRDAILDELPEARVEEIKERLEQTLSTTMMHPTHPPHEQKKAAWPKKYLGLVACLLLVSGFACYFMINRKILSVNNSGHKEIQYVGEVFASHDGIRQVLLPDGTLVSLNRNSELRLAAGFGQDNRHVSLEGEGYFDVAHDARQPFVINGRQMTIQVLGTTFIAKSAASEQSVGLLTGKVQVLHRSQQLTLEPGEFAIRGADSNSFSKERKDVASLLTWKPQTFELTNITMAELADFIAKRYDMKLEFTNNDLRRCRITHTLAGDETWEELLSVVSLVNQFTYQVKRNRIVITGGGCAETN
ncbi:iron dicitrate transporter FecR [Parapedobacter defluvii]|uniref:Iron dicitrate transporter FecR n=1 Tax=Parapedobacter defluvii TaxID=2045106 RepID=A0ABQ1LF11_9SPHI|nr:FecR domain-containing protein [Parapedobacter defluvii]GGC23723.1 iron dicitrate transporter FecR [Parapedobacter defluvii]